MGKVFRKGVVHRVQPAFGPRPEPQPERVQQDRRISLGITKAVDLPYEVLFKIGGRFATTCRTLRPDAEAAKRQPAPVKMRTGV